jgi:hypothetical protein
MKRRIVSCVWKGAQGLRVVPVVGPLGGRLAPGPWEPALGLQPPVVHFLLVPLFGPIKLYYLFEKIMKGTKIRRKQKVKWHSFHGLGSGLSFSSYSPRHPQTTDPTLA